MTPSKKRERVKKVKSYPEYPEPSQKRVVLGEGYLYEYVGRKGTVEMVGLEKKPTYFQEDCDGEITLKNTEDVNHKKIRLIAEILP